jgi:microcystin degradation protein MlrC
MKGRFRVAVGSIFTECNDFVSKPTDLESFQRQRLVQGPGVLEIDNGAVGGMLACLQDGEAEAVPLVVASACPGGRLTAECYRRLKTELLGDLRAAMPVDGVLLALHGAAAAEDAGDLEGDLLAAVRELVGHDRLIVATLDLHAHVTRAMVAAADALVAWETYPHRDAYSTGVRAARLLFDAFAGNVKPVVAMAKVPLLVGGVLGHTEGDGPFAEVMRLAKSHEGAGGVLSTSVFLVHPYLDVEEMGGGALVVADGDPRRAATVARELARQYWNRRTDLEPPVHTPAEAIALGMRVDGGPVLLVETADCCGGGAAGDSVATLRTLVEAGIDAPSLACVVDPAAAAACHQAGRGRSVTLELGHQVDRRWGRPMTVTGEVVRLGDGRFTYTGGIWAAQHGDMGSSAVLRVGQVQVLITTHATYDWADEQYRSFELDARRAKFVVVKNPMNYRIGLQGVYRAAYILDTPGPTPAVVDRLDYKHVRRPYFPADREIFDLEPIVYASAERGVRSAERSVNNEEVMR